MAPLHELVNIITWPMSTGKHGGYNFWSGSLAPSPWAAGTILLFVKHKNCHVKGCWRVGHNHPSHGWPSCRHHYREIPEHAQS